MADVRIDWDEARARLAEDGVVHLPQVLDAAQLEQALEAWRWSLANPALGGKVPQATDSTFYQDLYNPRCLEGYRAMLEASPIPAICADLWGTPDRSGSCTSRCSSRRAARRRRTPWHQDASYLADRPATTLAVAWITFEPRRRRQLAGVRARLAPGHALQHLALRPDRRDPPHPAPRRPCPALPDIEADRAAWEIVSWAVDPGDLIVFHPAMLHGGAATHPGQRRRRPPFARA